MASKEEALAIVKALVSRFEEQLPSYKMNYSETQTRIDFIDPFFKALWSSFRFHGSSCCYLSNQTLNQFNHGL